MKVLFLEDVPGTAYAGDIKDVKNGFARNYLLPRKLAVHATPDQMSRVERLRAAAAKRRESMERDMGAVAERLDGAVIRLEARAGRNNRLYGSITNAMVAQAVSELAGTPIDRRRIVMDPLRHLGTYTIPIRLYPGIEARVNVVVAAPGELAEGEPEPTAEEVIQELEAGGPEAEPGAEAQPEDEPAAQ